MWLLYKEKPRLLALVSETHSLLFKQIKANSSSPSVAIEVAENHQVTQENGFRKLFNREVYGCLGLINIEDQNFLAIITGALTNVAHPVDYESIDKIFSVDFVSLSNDEWDFVNLDANGMPVVTSNATNPAFDENSDYPRAAHPCYEFKKLLSNGSFYYSNDFDLTSLLQNRGINNAKLNKRDNLHLTSTVEHYQRDYMWNSFIMEDLNNFRSNLDPYFQEVLDKNRFLTTVIRGFARTIRINSSGDSISIVSKQSWKRAGTRFNARGIDDNGFVANFVETEFIYCNLSHSAIFSFTQIRGSVPAFWEQDSTLINPKITLTRSVGATQPIVNKHFADICQKYGVCHIVNLLSKTKPAEVALLSQYKQLFSNSDHTDEISYSEFDFHHETKQSGFAGASKILPLLHDSLEQFGWLYYDTSQDEIITRQDGVFRVNCLDCLDRTNLIQQVVCQNVMEHILKNQSATFGNTHRDRGNIDEFIGKHNSLWADNGDAISQIYTGTNALKSSFSRSGKMNLAGALSDVSKSVSRMYQNTFVDGKKQSTMDILLGYDLKTSKPVKIHDPINDYVVEKVKEKAHFFTTHNNIKIFVGTFNVNALDPDDRNIDLLTWLFPPENLEDPLPDVFAIGLQELIELNAGSILKADATRPPKWSHIISEQLNSQAEQYLLLRTESMTSMTLLLFVKKSQVHNVTQVAGSSKKTGLGGITANKGACGVRFDFGLTSFVLITSHLAAGAGAVVERFNDYSTILQGLTFTRNMTIKDHDHILWFGDLNYRISLQNDHCRSLVESGAFDELLSVEQLNQEMTQKGAFFGFKEGPIKFYPTYKFDKGTSNYDSSEKQRVPSWTDRVLHMGAKGKDAIQQINYNSVMDNFLSDHKPVYATFDCKVEFIDNAKKLQLSKNLYENYKLERGNTTDVSILELSSIKSQSSAESTESTFKAETLAELNLLDDDISNTPPSLPLRNNPRTNTLPRRLPPPSRSNNITPSSNIAINSTPPPPPTRRGNSGAVLTPTKSEVHVPIGFSSSPLVPSRPGTPLRTSGSNESNLGTSRITRPSHEPLKPIVPTKPTSLTSSKTGKNDSNLSMNSNLIQQESFKKLAPAPPPPRIMSTSSLSSNSIALQPKSMSEWKPLVPK